MRARRVLMILGAITLALAACVGVFVTQPFAQEMMGPGMDMGMAGGPGGGGAGAGGHSYQWTENAMPEELLMNYGEFLAQEGQAPVPLPEVYLMEEDGTPKRYTRNMWYSLARVYADETLDVPQPLTGQPGGKMWNQVYLEAAVKHNEVNVIWERWKDALTNFWFEVGHPRIGPQLLRYDWERKAMHNPDGTVRWGRWEATLPDSFTITVPVVMHVKDGCQKNYGRKFYNALKKFDNPGHGRSPFEFVTWDGGAYRKARFYLADETIQVWNDLWGRVQVQLRLFDPEGKEIVRAAQPSGLTPGLFTQMLHPPTIYYNPRYRLLLPPDDQKFNGGRLNLDGKEGWYFEFEFTLTKDQLKALDNAAARIVVDGGPPEQMKFIGPVPGGAAGGAGGAGMGPGGAGMPGMGGETPGMGGEMPGMGPAMPGGPGGGAMGMGPQ